jgi:hypothetical protein
MSNLLVYIFLAILLKTVAIKLIINKIIDIRNININKFSVYDSIFFIPFDEFIEQKNKYTNYAINNNFIYVYKTEKQSPFAVDFLMVKYFYNMEMPIVTSTDKYFKPFQYTVYDILLYQYFENKLIFKDKIHKEANHYIIDNNNNDIIRF